MKYKYAKNFCKVLKIVHNDCEKRTEVCSKKKFYRKPYEQLREVYNICFFVQYFLNLQKNLFP